MRSFPFVRPLAMLLAVVSFTGCSSWRPTPGSPDPARIPADTEEVRVRLSDGSRLKLQSPVFQADSLRGFASKPSANDHFAGKSAPRALAPANIASLERKHFDPEKTFALVVGIGLVGAAVAFLAISASNMSPLSGLDYARTPAEPAPVSR